nr:GntR family transcriptional regulator [uncultured Brevundimonas sp.]
MRQRDPFGTALNSLRQALDEGLAPGQHLSVTDIAAALGLSTSPVREALSRLCGEGLVEDRRGLGYFTRAAPLEDVLGLFDLEAAHVRLAAQGAGLPGPEAGGDLAVEAWIDALVETCENQPLVESLMRVRRRLSPLRRLNGPTDADLSERDGCDVEAYYARWRSAAGSLASRVRRIDPDQAKYTRNIV